MAGVSNFHILLLGGTGRVGQLVLKEALSRGYPVTALVRKTGALASIADPGFKELTGTPTATADITKALSTMPADANVVIISTLGQTRKSRNPWSAATSPPKFMAQSAQVLVDALKENAQREKPVHVSKFITLSVFGAAESFQNLNILMRGIMAHSTMALTVEDHSLVDETVKKHFGTGNGKLDVEFVIIRAPMLKFDAEKNGIVKTHGNSGATAGFMPSIQARDVVRFMVDALETSKWNSQTPVVSN